MDDECYLDEDAEAWEELSEDERHAESMAIEMGNLELSNQTLPPYSDK